MTFFRRVLPLLLAAVVHQVAQVASAQARLRIENVMTPTDRVATGVSKLTPAQRAAFERWLNQYTSMVFDAGAKGSTAKTSPGPLRPYSQRPNSRYNTYLGVGGGHWIDSNSDGKIITLEDGSIWQINDLDQIDTALWLPITDITVLHADSPIGDYRYVLINKDDGEKALAKYLGKD